jgi:hypothetical protein
MIFHEIFSQKISENRGLFENRGLIPEFYLKRMSPRPRMGLTYRRDGIPGTPTRGDP